ncbi:toll/interleukin-1 receptor domain-containing protein [Calothrix sp. 336/3]|uniref:toll/interleukin-1 receptor domain-containing protein n=1 Tax=Calothrix sp. 336/3 TaxID=1337936 RepID=UPI0004E2E9FE|nr:toll/interleukin-1 receptor domain-containing protein [Calothrix sp. 336/3]AKG23907.1 hypothetical protein IJ00_23690 [Calothrix sp. 336/3]
MSSATAIDLLYCCSDSPKDEELQQRLEKHLSLMKRQGIINTWHKGMMGAGEDWEREMDRRLNTANIILLLISSDLIYSDYHWNFLVQRAMELDKNRQARVLAILLCPYDNWKSEFGRIKVLPHPNKPVSKWRNYDHAFEKIAKGIREEAKAINDPYFAIRKSLTKIGNVTKTVVGNIFSNTNTKTNLLSSSFVRHKHRKKSKLSLTSIFGVCGGLVLLTQFLLPQINLSKDKSNKNVKPKSQEFSSGWIQLGVIDKSSNLSIGTPLLRPSNTKFFPSIEPPIVPQQGSIVSVKYKVNLRMNKFLSSEQFRELQPGEKLIIQKVEKFQTKNQNSRYVILRAQVKKCDRTCNKN